VIEWARSLKSDTPCADYGLVFHHAAMHWDHLPGTEKVAEVSNMVRKGRGKASIRDEIAKCELVCANCHAVRSFHRLGV
jgi:hypothetical protein